jgi:hypothetical protein
MTDTDSNTRSGWSISLSQPHSIAGAAWVVALSLFVLVILTIVGHAHDRGQATALEEHRVAILHSQAALLQAQMDATAEAIEHHRALEAWACAQTIIAMSPDSPTDPSEGLDVAEQAWSLAADCDRWERPLHAESREAGDRPRLRDEG